MLDYRNPGLALASRPAYPGGIDRAVRTGRRRAILEPCFRSLAKTWLAPSSASRRVTKSRGFLPICRYSPGELAGVDARYLGESDPARVRTILAIIFRLAERGWIWPVIDQRFALSDAPARYAPASIHGSEKDHRHALTRHHCARSALMPRNRNFSRHAGASTSTVSPGAAASLPA